MVASKHLGLIARIIREAPDVASGARVLHEIARHDVPADLPVWDVLSGIAWANDVVTVREAWIQRSRTCIPPDASGIYFGLDGVSMPEGRGVQLGCSADHLPGWHGIDYVFNCEIFCADIPLPSLSRLYSWLYAQNGYETFGSVDNMLIEYPICLGCGALVFRDALRTLDPADLAGENIERCFAFGFHDGDLLRLGRATQEGYINDATFDCW